MLGVQNSVHTHTSVDQRAEMFRKKLFSLILKYEEKLKGMITPAEKKGLENRFLESSTPMRLVPTLYKAALLDHSCLGYP